MHFESVRPPAQAALDVACEIPELVHVQNGADRGGKVQINPANWGLTCLPLVAVKCNMTHFVCGVRVLPGGISASLATSWVMAGQSMGASTSAEYGDGHEVHREGLSPSLTSALSSKALRRSHLHPGRWV